MNHCWCRWTRRWRAAWWVRWDNTWSRWTGRRCWTGGSSQRGNWQSLVIIIPLLYIIITDRGLTTERELAIIGDFYHHPYYHQNAGWKAHLWGELAIRDDYSSSSPSYKSSSLTNMIIISGKYSSLTGLATMDFSSETANSAHSSSSSQVVLLISK